MDQQEAIAEIEREARRAGFSIAALCKRAGVHPTSFSRWKRTPGNPKPASASYNAIISLRATLKAMIEERDAGQPKAAWA
jgi:transposase-like protein